MRTPWTGILFDFDGVIADTEHLHYVALSQTLEPRGAGFTWEQYEVDFIGFDDRDAIRAAHQLAGIAFDESDMPALLLEKAGFFDRLVTKEAPPPLPGAVETVRAATELGPVALCTGAVRSDVLPLLEQFGLLPCFDAIVTAEDVAKSKPDPESYRLAAQSIGKAPSQCLAIEDTPGGLTSARAAGCHTVGVTTTHSEEQLAALADRVVDVLAPAILL